ncbi:DNA-binding protein [Sulfurimonas sp.]|uniref:DNA-binding protein n=1 Tax=Sulfurimonas sp. TaxID=2022749 RepID=UPI00263691B2|nr:DNA-binding protein [Sulfurimonas sp.]
MKKLNIADAAEYFGVSKEAIHNRVRRGSLQSVVENGIKMVILDDARVKPAVKKTVQARRTTVNNDRYYKLLEEQNAKLQSRVDVLEDETRSLRDQKELMLIEEREKIERIYKEKDEQLKNILSSIASKFMLDAPVQAEEEMLEAEIELAPLAVEEEAVSESISLNKYLKKQDFSEKKIKKIKARFKKIAKEDDRVVMVGSKLYIDTAKYDYSDIIR